jgi:hypothetical protein
MWKDLILFGFGIDMAMVLRILREIWMGDEDRITLDGVFQIHKDYEAFSSHLFVFDDRLICILHCMVGVYGSC